MRLGVRLMKTLADFKRAMTMGRSIRVTYLRHGETTPNIGEIEADTLRHVSHVGTTQFATRFGDTEKCWKDYGKAGEWTFDGNTATWTDPYDTTFQVRYTVDPGGDT